MPRNVAASRHLFSNFFGKKKPVADAASAPATQTPSADAVVPAAPLAVDDSELFAWAAISDGDTRIPPDPVKVALLQAGAYFDPRVHWLPYTHAELARRSKRMAGGVPLRMSALTVSEPVNVGTLLCCLPMDLCASPGFAAHTPQLVPLLRALKDEYTGTVGQSTFSLSKDNIGSIILVTLASTMRGPLMDMIGAITEVENMVGRREMLSDPTNIELQAASTGDDSTAGAATGACSTDDVAASAAANNKQHGAAADDDDHDDFAELSPFMRELCATLPLLHDDPSMMPPWRQFLDLLAARKIAIKSAFDDLFGAGSKFEGACSMDEFERAVHLFFCRSAIMPDAIQDALNGERCYVPFYDCADHDAAAPDCLSLKFFKPGAYGGGKFSAEQVPHYTTAACKGSPCIGVFAARDLEPRMPITRGFAPEHATAPSTENLWWLMHQGCVPWQPATSVPRPKAS